jgi:hypothetical protein
VDRVEHAVDDRVVDAGRVLSQPGVGSGDPVDDRTDLAHDLVAGQGRVVDHRVDHLAARRHLGPVAAALIETWRRLKPPGHHRVLTADNPPLGRRSYACHVQRGRLPVVGEVAGAAVQDAQRTDLGPACLLAGNLRDKRVGGRSVSWYGTAWTPPERGYCLEACRRKRRHRMTIELLLAQPDQFHLPPRLRTRAGWSRPSRAPWRRSRSWPGLPPAPSPLTNWRRRPRPE